MTCRGMFSVLLFNQWSWSLITGHKLDFESRFLSVSSPNLRAILMLATTNMKYVYVCTSPQWI